MPQVLLGCIADDFTGATDLANNLVRGGMRVIQPVGVPRSPLEGAADAVVIALKSRTIAAAEAIAQSLVALRWLQAQGPGNSSLSTARLSTACPRATPARSPRR